MGRGRTKKPIPRPGLRETGSMAQLLALSALHEKNALPEGEFFTTFVKEVYPHIRDTEAAMREHLLSDQIE